MNKYEVIFAGTGAGYNRGDIINISKEFKKIYDIACQINIKSNLRFLDIGLLEGNENEMTFGTKMDGIIFKTPVLKVKRIN